MFSLTTEYALRVIMFLASREDQPATIHQIAAATKVPEAYLAKVILCLSKVEMIHSQRGLHGGSMLARSPTLISVFDVVQAVDPIRRITTCPLEIKSHGHHLCALHKRMDEALGLVETALRESKISELLAEPTGSKPLCGVEGEIDERPVVVGSRGRLKRKV